MSKKRIVFAFDLDGTLLTDGVNAHPETQDAIIKSYNQGHANIICTGRGLQKTLPLLKTIKGINYFVCSNGALFYDVEKDYYRVLGEVDKSIFNELFDYANTNNLILTIDTPDFNGSWSKNSDKNILPEWVSKQNKLSDKNPHFLKPLSALTSVLNNPESKITQMAIRNPLDSAQETTKHFQGRLKGKQKVFLTNSIYTDVNPLHTTKWYGLKTLLDYLKIDTHELYCFGDSGNDIEMLQNAHIGYAMGNGTNDAKLAADKIIGSNLTGAIGQVINEILEKN
ncbi:HAD family hydrolase [Mycoplasmopsis caviae]|uniref:COF family HAD hydrolase protein n=1 Tax=Mycoplasmopsis caviae TaxID=55603 RepID=A0A3P8KLL0_9BACT|nr:HAD family hydrolase [Mycoplasmopsis caviae]UUD35614.1 HAD family hydrolase [Mycoplasmopsis caviae]VDR41628.1 COF family HAD hydrolase protein [Mycoplasmopsis caviae]